MRVLLVSCIYCLLYMFVFILIVVFWCLLFVWGRGGTDNNKHVLFVDDF